MVKALSIEKQVCALEQAKKLVGLLGEHAPKSLWVWSKIDGYWAWSKIDEYGTWGIVLMDHYCKNPSMPWGSDFYPAYTGDEVGVLLPDKIFFGKYQLHKKDNLWLSGYVSEGDYPHEWPSMHNLFGYGEDKNIVCAMTNSLIALLEQKLIKPESLSYEI